MSIKINKLVHSVYEDEISYNVEIEVTNTGEVPIESVQSYSVLLSIEGQPLISEESAQEEGSASAAERSDPSGAHAQPQRHEVHSGPAGV